MKKAGGNYFISTGEFSGELLGADLVLALHQHYPRLIPHGITGDAMERAGVTSLARIEDLQVMGVAEVAARLPELRMLETSLLNRIERLAPEFAILVDFPAFHLRLAEQLAMRGIRVIQYVAPKVWAWGLSRMSSLRRDYHAVLGILPFEQDLFERYGVPYHYVGSPHVDRVRRIFVTREDFGLPADQPLLAALPGSRPSEVERTLPLILDTVRRLRKQYKMDVHCWLPIAESIDPQALRTLLTHEKARWTGSPTATEPLAVIDELKVSFWRGQSLEIMAVADAALVTSGTATLECALLGTPLSVVYAMNRMTYWVAKRAVQVEHVSLVNLIAGQELVKEFIQDFDLDDVAADLDELMTSEVRRRRLKDAFNELYRFLGRDAAQNAARIIYELMG